MAFAAEDAKPIKDLESQDQTAGHAQTETPLASGNDGTYYSQLPDVNSRSTENANKRDSTRVHLSFLAAIFCGFGVVVCLALLSLLSWPHQAPPPTFLLEQRTAFHFQPQKNWMNDPNGPMFYKGYYHFFYQYNPDAAVWGNITWAHSVSTDLIRWFHLNLALVPDHWYDADGVWSGSATILPDGRPVIFYTGSSNESVQLQSMAVPEQLTDPLLRRWMKIPQNPILVPPPGIGSKDFRDPTTAWLESDGLWRIAIGSKQGTTGVALIYQTSDFYSWTLQENLLHHVPSTGMWECVDFYPVSLIHNHGLDTSKVQSNQLVKYILKASLDDNKHDFYALGTYSTKSHTFTADNPTTDVGIGLRYDYGKYYASKTFYDPVKQRRILWGWANESDSVEDDVAKGWASVQTIPRSLVLDSITGSNLIQWPIEEVETLRGEKVTEQNIVLQGGALVKVNGASGAQLDVEVTFKYPNVDLLDVLPYTEQYDCRQGGAEHRGIFGPFGLLVLATDDLHEHTAVFFYLALQPNGEWITTVCSDHSRLITPLWRLLCRAAEPASPHGSTQL
ncbi:hypothetical protein O6H91_Y014400 [Diphasiastrum complanatum]|nr:hypothetical protein O6H91_Y014400 [Diphasiastrum complanatum]